MPRRSDSTQRQPDGRSGPDGAAGQRSWLAAAGLLLAGVAATGMFVVGKTNERRDLFIELTENQREQDELLNEYTRLLIERGMLSAYRNVDRIAFAARQISSSPCTCP